MVRLRARALISSAFFLLVAECNVRMLLCLPAVLFKPKYEVGPIYGPIQTKFGYHLIKIDARYIAEFDFRLKEEGVIEP